MMYDDDDDDDDDDDGEDEIGNARTQIVGGSGDK